MFSNSLIFLSLCVCVHRNFLYRVFLAVYWMMLLLLLVCSFVARKLRGAHQMDHKLCASTFFFCLFHHLFLFLLLHQRKWTTTAAAAAQYWRFFSFLVIYWKIFSFVRSLQHCHIKFLLMKMHHITQNWIVNKRKYKQKYTRDKRRTLAKRKGVVKRMAAMFGGWQYIDDKLLKNFDNKKICTFSSPDDNNVAKHFSIILLLLLLFIYVQCTLYMMISRMQFSPFSLLLLLLTLPLLHFLVFIAKTPLPPSLYVLP